MAEDDYLKRPPRFNADRNEDFQLWALRFEVLAEAKDLSSVLFTDAIENEDTDALESALKAKIIKGRALLVMCLGPKALRTVAAEKKNPFRMYKKLEERYATRTPASRVQLQTQLHQMKYDSGKSMSEYIDGLESIFNQLNSMDSPVDPSMQVAILLASFGTVDETPYGPVISALQTMTDERLTWEAASARLLQEYSTRIGVKPGSAELSAHASSELRALKSMARVRCYGCKRFGHYKRDCPNKKTKKGWNGKPNFNGNEQSALTVHTKDKLSVRFVVDSGASSHMVNCADLFSNCKIAATMTVSIGDGRKLLSNAVGTVVISVCAGPSVRNILCLKNVLLVQELDSNLLSCSELAKDGYSTVIEKNCCLIMKKTTLIGRAGLKNGLYSITGRPCGIRHIANVAEKTDASDRLWHQRYGHVHERCISEMIKHDSVSGMSRKDSAKTGKDCEHCIKGKMTRLSLKPRSLKATKPGEVIYSDVCGPISVASIGGANYFVTFTDDYSGHKEVRILHKKSEVLTSFAAYHKWFERQFSCQIKVLYSDRGGEFQALQEYLNNYGIQAEYSAPYTPQQNGISERSNRTLMDMTRAMLDQAGLPPSFWAEAVTTAVQLRNVTAPKVKGYKTPSEMLSGKKPDVRNLRIFGCEAWIHIPKRKKIASKARRGIVLRCLSRGNYRLWDIEGHRTVEVRHVMINETLFPARLWRKGDSNSRALKNWYANFLKLSEEPSPAETHSSVDNFSNMEDDEESISVLEDEEDIDETVSGADEDLISNADLDAVTHIPIVTSRHGEGPRYPSRDRRPTQRYGQIAKAASKTDEKLPTTVSQALQSKDSEHWRTAIDSEVTSLLDNNTWTVTELPPGQKSLDSRFVFQKKYKENGSIDRYKARLVVKGFQQGHVSDVYSPVIDFTTVRMAMTVALNRGYTVHQLDVKTAFLNGRLEDNECIYVRPPLGLDMGLPPNCVFKLNRALYGLKRASKIWNITFRRFMRQLGFTQFDSDECVFVSFRKGHTVYILIYVDDILVLCADEKIIVEIKDEIGKNFQIRDLGTIRKFLGVDFKIYHEGIFMTQETYTRQVLSRFGMDASNLVHTPMEKGYQMERTEEKIISANNYKEVIGCLLYLSTRTRPDIDSAVGILARDSSCPSEKSWKGIKRVMRYLNGTADHGLWIQVQKESTLRLVGYADSNWAGDLNDRKSTSGFVAFLGGAPITWLSKKQGSVALSTSEAEYIAMSECAKELKWLQNLAKEFKIVDPSRSSIAFCDNSGAISWATSGKRAKHVDIRLHFVRDLVEKKIMCVEFCPTEKMTADILTKPLDPIRFKELRRQLHVVRLHDVFPSASRRGMLNHCYVQSVTHKDGSA